MARPIGDKGAHKTIALSRPQGGWFAKIWNQRNRGGSSGGAATPAVTADKITLGRCAPFTLWVGEGINTVPPAADEPEPPANEPAEIGSLPSEALAKEHFDKQKEEEAPHHESESEPAVVAAADLGLPSRPPSRAFSIWTTKEALAARAIVDEDDEDEALVVFDECEGAVAAEVLEKLDRIPAPAAPKSRAFTLWTSAEAFATPKIMSMAPVVPAAAPTAFASRAFSIWTSGCCCRTFRVPCLIAVCVSLGVPKRSNTCEKTG